MELNFYKTNDAENVINKTLTDKLSLTVHFRNDVDIINPVLILTGEKLDGYNYAEIPHFSRYYFVERVESVGYNLWRVTLTCDVLETYKQDILNSYASFNKKLEAGDYGETSLSLTGEVVVTDYVSDVTLEPADNSLLSILRWN